MKIIGISGNKNSGKTTASQMIFERFILDGKYCKQFDFADPLKRALLQMFEPYNIKQEDLWGPSHLRENKIHFNNKSVSIRYLLQTLGEEWGRQLVYKNLWAELTLEKIKKEVSNINGIAIITDCRYLTELEEIKNNGGEIWHITRNQNIVDDPHPSEQEMNSCEFLNKVDKIIINNGSLEDLRNNLNEKIKGIK